MPVPLHRRALLALRRIIWMLLGDEHRPFTTL